MDDQRPIRAVNAHNLEKHIEQLQKDTANMVSAYTSPLNQVPFKIATFQPLGLPPVSMPQTEQHPLFQTPTEPEYNLDEFLLSQRKDPLHVKSMVEAQRGERIAGGPCGTWFPMGMLSQHHLPPSPANCAKPDMEMISFCIPIGNPQVDNSFEVF